MAAAVRSTPVLRGLSSQLIFRQELFSFQA